MVFFVVVVHCSILCLGDPLPVRLIVGVVVAFVVVIIIVVVVVVVVLRRRRSRLSRLDTKLLSVVSTLLKLF